MNCRAARQDCKPDQACSVARGGWFAPGAGDRIMRTIAVVVRRGKNGPGEFLMERISAGCACVAPSSTTPWRSKKEISLAPRLTSVINCWRLRAFVRKTGAAIATAPITCSSSRIAAAAPQMPSSISPKLSVKPCLATSVSIFWDSILALFRSTLAATDAKYRWRSTSGA